MQLTIKVPTANIVTDEFGELVADALDLLSDPVVVVVDASTLTVEHPALNIVSVGALVRLAAAYTHDPAWVPRRTRAEQLVAAMQAARQAHAGNAAFLALASPTAADVLAQVQALTRQVDQLIRLAAGEI